MSPPSYDYTKGKLPELVDIIIESGAKLFVSAVGVPPKAVVDKLHSAGVLYMNMIGMPSPQTLLSAYTQKLTSYAKVTRSTSRNASTSASTSSARKVARAAVTPATSRRRSSSPPSRPCARATSHP